MCLQVKGKRSILQNRLCSQYERVGVIPCATCEAMERRERSLRQTTKRRLRRRYRPKGVNRRSRVSTRVGSTQMPALNVFHGEREPVSFCSITSPQRTDGKTMLETGLIGQVVIGIAVWGELALVTGREGSRKLRSLLSLLSGPLRSCNCLASLLHETD